MAFPKCPNCPERKTPASRAADEITPAEANRYRSYRCHGCRKIFWTVEHVICADAETDWLVSKYGTDTAQEARPAGLAPARGDPEGGGGTSVPRNAPAPLQGEPLGIRGRVA